MTSKQLQALSKYTACDISDALLKLGVPHAGFLSDFNLRTSSSLLSFPIPPSSTPTIAPASTILFTSKLHPPPAHYPPANMPPEKHWVDLTVPGSIVIMQQAPDQKCAILGGIMALRMKMLEAKGVVCAGRVRDIEELSSTGLPVWSLATSTIGSGAESKPHAMNIPLTISGVRVNPKDIIFLDPVNGIVCIPAGQVGAVIAMLPGLLEADEKVKKEVLQGMSVKDAFKKHRG